MQVTSAPLGLLALSLMMALLTSGCGQRRLYSGDAGAANVAPASGGVIHSYSHRLSEAGGTRRIAIAWRSGTGIWPPRTWIGYAWSLGRL